MLSVGVGSVTVGAGSVVVAPLVVAPLVLVVGGAVVLGVVSAGVVWVTVSAGASPVSTRSVCVSPLSVSAGWRECRRRLGKNDRSFVVPGGRSSPAGGSFDNDASARG